MRPISSFAAFLQRLRRDQAGAVAAMVALSLVSFIGLTGLVIDMGHVFVVKRALQASTDAAALAAAQDVITETNAGDAANMAIAYSASSGGKNAIPGQSVTMTTGYPALKCLKTTGMVCAGKEAANAIVVRQEASVDTYFAKIFGLKKIDLAAISTAGAKGGVVKNLDVMIVLDTTASMNQSDNSCAIKNSTRLTCALAGIKVLLNQLTPSADKIGMMIFPGLTNASQAQYEYDCAASPPAATAAYSANPVYQVLALSGDYRSQDSSTTLNSSSNLVKAAGAGGTACTQGISPAATNQYTYFADAINAAQAALTASSRPNTQKVIVFLSDGDANAPSAYISAAKKNNQCAQAVTAAKAAAATGTWVYSIAYGAETSSSKSCQYDKPAISGCTTMQNIASDPKKFFSDNAGSGTACASAAQSITELTAVFQAIAFSLQPPRLLSDNTG